MKNPLYIAEKPDMGKKIAAQLKGPHKAKDGYIETGEGNVTWAIGHLLEQGAPDEYGAQYKQWKMETLPIFPQKWKLLPIKGKTKQLYKIKELIKEADCIINAGDPGREGQLIVDEILDYFSNKKPVYRLLLNALDAKSIQTALKNIQPNSNFKNLYQSAIARQRADWLVGMNATRGYTLLGKKSGYQHVFSVGRVQTPTLAIIVNRESEIENFKPITYYDLKIHVGEEKINPFWAKLKVPSPDSNEEFDEEIEGEQVTGKITDKNQAETIFNKVKENSIAKVVLANKTPIKEKQPLPFKLATLQSKANAMFGISVQETLDICQSLYEKGITSYPRTDSEYLPLSQHEEAKTVIHAIQQVYPEYNQIFSKLDFNIKSSTWNDAKVGEHHAIIPTSKAANLSDLTANEKRIFELIIKSYIAQFLPECEVDRTHIELEAGNEKWIANGRVVIKPGWREIFDDGNKSNEESLPSLTAGQNLNVLKRLMEEKQTQPPPRFTEGTLLKAMQNVHKLVSNPEEKKALKNVEGIGRAATRANIIQTLFKRKYIVKKGKYIIPLDEAKILIKYVDEKITKPELTAKWEQILDGIASGKVTLEVFEEKQKEWVSKIIHTLNSQTIQQKPKTESPISKQTKTNVKCEKCGKDMVQRKVKTGPHKGKTFLGCTGYPQCSHTIWKT